MNKVLTIIGARPQFIKAAVVSRALTLHRPDVEEVLVHTGQHYDANMSDVFFNELDIPHPSHNLGVGGGSHGANTGRMLEKLEVLMQREAPNIVLVYGDTDSTLAGSLAAAKLHIPVIHVEAGLRSFNKRMPEELNRILTDHVSTLLLTPTEQAKQNLLNEGIERDTIRVVGDVMYDAAIYYKNKARKPHWFDELGIESHGYILSTIHRAENTDDQVRLIAILKGLSGSKDAVILPLHPRTRKKIGEMDFVPSPNLKFVDPVGYLEMVWLEANCRLIATDSGGVQKEAYFHGKPCVTLRDETEWTELVECGANRLVGANSDLIAHVLQEPNRIISKNQLYGQGNAAEMVAEILSKFRK